MPDPSGAVARLREISERAELEMPIPLAEPNWQEIAERWCEQACHFHRHFLAATQMALILALLAIIEGIVLFLLTRKP